MWVRKRIEVSTADLASGLGYCVAPGDREATTRQIGDQWHSENALVCLSVRSGFDVMLHSSGWPRGSEIIMSSLTIPDMPKIVRENGMVPVGVDIDLESMTPDVDKIRARITPRTRAIVVAHLLGGLCDISQIVELAREHDVLVIEDCAQAYVGSSYQGDPQADVSMFSFGPIKTNTALGGAVFHVRQPELLEQMQRAHDQWRFQTRFSFGRRVLKYGFVKVISTRPICGGFYRFLKLFGRNHDGIASSMARGFAGPRFFDRIRRQPSTSLLRLLDYKLGKFDPAKTDHRSQLGRQFADQAGDQVYVLGADMVRQTFWVLAILVEEPQPLVRKLWDSGFDASNSCSLNAIHDDKQSVAGQILQHIVFLPLHAEMPESEIARMAGIIRDASPGIPVFVESSQLDEGELAETGLQTGVVPEPHFDEASLVEPVTR
ncbi:MAG: DegT/DnrJ/EryC1/StrS family aminotransferase [Pirellulaceae bacterium]